MKLQRDSYAPKSCAFDAANVQFLRAHLCKSHPVLQHHTPAPPTVKFENCLQCHGGVDKLISRKPVHAVLKNGKPNCGMCHKGHKE